MTTDRLLRRMIYAFLCSVPFLAIGLVAVRDLRIPGVYQTIGGVLFLAMCVAAWRLGLRTTKHSTEMRRLAVAGGLLLSPFALVSLLWVGLGAPWDATPTENRMRYLVLLAGTMAIAAAFIVLKEALSDAGERIYSTLGFAANIFASAAYLFWLTFMIGVFVAKVRDGQVPPAVVSMGDVYDILLFVACVLIYLATAAFAASMGRAGWLSRGATRAYVIANLVALIFIVMRGLSFPDPNASSTPWYMHPGFIAGIPAVPWIMPFLLGVVLLRLAGNEPSLTKAAT